MEVVILRLKMIQCNPTCDDSTGSVRVTKMTLFVQYPQFPDKNFM
jgi:hypothetical protein